MKRKKEENYKNAQASMEFLITYGWVILVVLVAIGALAYFGVLSPARFLPESCILMSGLNCEEFIVTPEGMIIFVKNGFGKSLSSVKITLVGSDDDKCVGASDFVDNLADGELARFNIYCDNGPEENSRFVSDLLIQYTYGSLYHTKKGRIIAFIQGLPGSGLDEIVCINADPELCSGLDIVFGQGYKDGCCEEFEVCC